MTIQIITKRLKIINLAHRPIEQMQKNYYLEIKEIEMIAFKDYIYF